MKETVEIILIVLRMLVAVWIIYTSWFVYSEYRDTGDSMFPKKIIYLTLGFAVLTFLVITSATVRELSDLQDSSGQTASASSEQQEEETNSKAKESLFDELWTDQTNEADDGESGKRGR